MKVNVAREVAALKRMTVKELCGRYLDVFGETTRSGNKDWLWKRITWRMQANAEGDLTERARRPPAPGASPYVPSAAMAYGSLAVRGRLPGLWPRRWG